MSPPFFSPEIPIAKSMKMKHIYSNVLVIFIISQPYLRHIWKRSPFGMIFFKRDFWARVWSVVGIYGVQPGSRRFKHSIGGSLGANQPFYSGKFETENEFIKK